METFWVKVAPTSPAFLEFARDLRENRCAQAAVPRALLGRLFCESACRSGSLLDACSETGVRCLESLIRLEGRGGMSQVHPEQVIPICKLEG